uniref:Uncharacterized protein n=1 Tax=Rhizophora mucronata TaxID=61149 RepID=A0A2P2PP16_RHIMU
MKLSNNSRWPKIQRRECRLTTACIIIGYLQLRRLCLMEVTRLNLQQTFQKVDRRNKSLSSIELFQQYDFW